MPYGISSEEERYTCTRTSTLNPRLVNGNQRSKAEDTEALFYAAKTLCLPLPVQ